MGFGNGYDSGYTDCETDNRKRWEAEAVAKYVAEHPGGEGSSSDDSGASSVPSIDFVFSIDRNGQPVANKLLTDRTNTTARPVYLVGKNLTGTLNGSVWTLKATYLEMMGGRQMLVDKRPLPWEPVGETGQVIRLTTSDGGPNPDNWIPAVSDEDTVTFSFADSAGGTILGLDTLEVTKEMEPTPPPTITSCHPSNDSSATGVVVSNIPLVIEGESLFAVTSINAVYTGIEGDVSVTIPSPYYMSNVTDSQITIESDGMAEVLGSLSPRDVFTLYVTTTAGSASQSVQFMVSE